jgi:hypothetical protein
MIELKDTIEINASAETVFKCLLQQMKDKESYKAWHPEHKEIKWLKGEPLEEGSVVYIEEYLQGVLQKLTFRFVQIIPNRLIKYRVLFPLSLIAPENRFEIEPTGDNSCRFTASGRIRMPMWLFLRSHKSHKGKLEGSRKHMKEEGENLKALAESDSFNVI